MILRAAVEAMEKYNIEKVVSRMHRLWKHHALYALDGSKQLVANDYAVQDIAQFIKKEVRALTANSLR